MRVVATIEDPVVIRKILKHLGFPTEVPAPRAPPSDLFDWKLTSSAGAVCRRPLAPKVRPPAASGAGSRPGGSL